MSAGDNNATLVRDYLAWVHDVKGLAGSTTYVYAGVLGALLEHLGRTDLTSASVAQLEAFIQRPRNGRAAGGKGSAATQVKDVNIVRTFYAYLLGRGLVAQNPSLMLVSPKIANVNPKPVPDDLWLSVWDAELTEPERIVLGLGYFCGLRRAEIVGLRPHQVTPQALVAFTRKGGGDDIFPMASALAVWADYMPHLGSDRFLPHLLQMKARNGTKPFLLPSLTLFEAPQRRYHQRPAGMNEANSINRLVTKMFRRLELPLDSFQPHSLRHSFVSGMLRAGVPLHLVSRLANHSDPGVTMRYVRAGGQELGEWHRSFQPREVDRFTGRQEL